MQQIYGWNTSLLRDSDLGLHSELTVLLSRNHPISIRGHGKTFIDNSEHEILIVSKRVVFEVQELLHAAIREYPPILRFFLVFLFSVLEFEIVIFIFAFSLLLVGIPDLELAGDP